MNQPNIYPVFDQLISRNQKEEFLDQRACVVWMTGLSGSGKTTLAKYLERKLLSNGYLSKLLDGDNLRTGLNSSLGFNPEDRIENVRRAAEISKLFVEGGLICVNSFVSPTDEIRGLARDVIGPSDFVEVYINTPLAECEYRDVKGLYARARAGELVDFTGISAPFEPPMHPAIEIKTVNKSIEACGQELFEELLPIIKFQHKHEV